MFRCDATTTTGERLTLYGHCLTPQQALRMVLECWRHAGVAVAAVKVWRGELAKGKPALKWEKSLR
jgi:hypothetical protein